MPRNLTYAVTAAPGLVLGAVMVHATSNTANDQLAIATLMAVISMAAVLWMGWQKLISSAWANGLALTILGIWLGTAALSPAVFGGYPREMILGVAPTALGTMGRTYG